MALFDLGVINILTTILVAILSLYYFSVKTYNHWKILGVKYAKPVPFFGNTFLTTFRKKSPPVNQQELYNMFPDEKYVGMFMFRTPFLVVRDPQLVHCILSKDFVHFYDRGITIDERLDLLSSHLVNLRGQQWKSIRSKLTPAFSSGKLKSMCSQLDGCATVLSDYLEMKEESQDIREIMAKFATDVIGSCAFGLQFNSLRDPDSQFRKMGREVFKPTFRFLFKFIARTFHPSLPYYLNLKAFSQDVENFFLNFVRDAMHQRKENNIERKDFIQLLIELRKEESTGSNQGTKEKSVVLTEQVMASNAFVFFLAGFETTSSTMSFFLLEMAVNPSIQEAVRNEISKALEKHNGNLNYETIKDLPYMDMVISETMRKYPIATALLRECTQTYQVPQNSLVIEKGTKVLIPVFSLHRDPLYFPDPDQFDPERFSPENKSKIVQGTYLPFGDGPRICIGLRFAMMEMKFAFCKIMPKFEFTLSDRMVFPVEFKKGSPLLAPEDGIWLNVRRRDVETTKQ
uniref:Cytochrome P450 n=1 Tax=Graphocephala atropunctata TaxID=36148 RepID=A0A1B6KMA9_9HEMI